MAYTDSFLDAVSSGAQNAAACQLNTAQDAAINTVVPGLGFGSQILNGLVQNAFGHVQAVAPVAPVYNQKADNTNIYLGLGIGVFILLILLALIFYARGK